MVATAEQGQVQRVCLGESDLMVWTPSTAAPGLELDLGSVASGAGDTAANFVARSSLHRLMVACESLSEKPRLGCFLLLCR